MTTVKFWLTPFYVIVRSIQFMLGMIAMIIVTVSKACVFAGIITKQIDIGCRYLIKQMMKPNE